MDDDAVLKTTRLTLTVDYFTNGAKPDALREFIEAELRRGIAHTDALRLRTQEMRITFGDVPAGPADPASFAGEIVAIAEDLEGDDPIIAGHILRARNRRRAWQLRALAARLAGGEQGGEGT